MKKTLMSIVLGAAAMVLMVGGVKAAECDINAETGADNACAASVGTTGFANASNAMTEVTTNGGTFTLLNGQYTPGSVLEFKATATVDTGDLLFRPNSIKVDEGATLTLRGSNIVINTAAIEVEEGATLIIDGATIKTTASGLINASGDVTITAGSTIDAGTHTLVTVNPGAVVSLNGNITAGTVVATAGAPVNGISTAAEVTVLGGEYNTTNVSFDADNGLVLNLNGGKVVSTNRVITMKDAIVTIDGTELITNSSAYSAIVSEGASDKAKLTINSGKAIATTQTALSIQNPMATYAINGGTYESGEGKAALWLSNNCYNAEKNAVVAKLQGIISNGSFLNKIVATVEGTNGGTYDVSAQLVKAGVKIETVDGYVVVGEGTPADEQTEGTPAPESQEATGNTADAKNHVARIKK